MTTSGQAVETAISEEKNSPIDMKDIVALCKRRGFIFLYSKLKW